MEQGVPQDLVLVSGLIRPRQSGAGMNRDVASYLANFAKIAATGLPIVLFLDRTLIGVVDYPNVRVIPVTLAELSTYHATLGLPEPLLLPVGAEQDDTLDYLIIQNAKTELVARALDLEPEAGTVAWIDFGVFHIIKDAPLAQRRLHALQASPDDQITIPGCWPVSGDDPSQVNWRFCGGLFWGTPAAHRQFAAHHQRTFRTLLPRVSWEVNLWALMEQEGLQQFHWYLADHDDSIFAFPGSPASRQEHLSRP